MHIGIIGLQHESNTAVASPTTIEDFGRKYLLEGEAVRSAYAPVCKQLSAWTHPE